MFFAPCSFLIQIVWQEILQYIFHFPITVTRGNFGVSMPKHPAVVVKPTNASIEMTFFFLSPSQQLK